MNLNETTIKTEYKFKGSVVNVRVDTVKTPKGNIATRDVVEHPGGVAIVALDDEGNVIMERQYRRPLDKVIFEIPAGKLNYGEDPLECAKRELEEETGLCAKNFESLGFIYPSPGFCDERLYLFLATGLYEGRENRDEDEFLEIVKTPIKELVEMIKNDQIVDSKSIAAIMKTYLKLYS